MHEDRQSREGLGPLTAMNDVMGTQGECGEGAEVATIQVQVLYWYSTLLCIRTPPKFVVHEYL